MPSCTTARTFPMVEEAYALARALDDQEGVAN
jgi:hypothetical protein